MFNMAKCPCCGETLPFFERMFLYGKKVIRCRKCSAMLMIDHRRMLAFYLPLYFFSVVLGLAVGFSEDIWKPLGVFLLFIVLMTSLYPVALKLKVSEKSKSE